MHGNSWNPLGRMLPKIWVLFIMAAPLLFGGNRVWAWSLWGGGFGLLTVWWALLHWQGCVRRLSWKPLIPVAIPFFILWGDIVASLWGLSVHGVWQQAQNVLGEPIRQWGTLNPEGTMLGLVQLLLYGLVFSVSYAIGYRSGHLRRLLQGLAVAGGLQALYGLYVVSLTSEFVLWWPKDWYVNSVTGTFINKNSYATYAAMASLASLWWGLRAFEKVWVKVRGDKYPGLMFLQNMNAAFFLPILLCCLNFAALFLSHSRAGLASFLIGFIVFLALWVRHNHQVRLPRFSGVFLILFLGVLGVFALNSSQEIMSRFSKISEDITNRVEIYKPSIQLIDNNKIFGYGYKSFPEAIHLVREDNPEIWDPARITKIHNTYLQIIAEIGFIGFAAILSIFFVVFFNIFRSKSVFEDAREYIPIYALTCVICVHSLVDFSLEIPGLALTWLALLGALYGCATKYKVSEVKGGWMCFVYAGVGSGLAIILFLLAWSQMYQAQEPLLRKFQGDPSSVTSVELVTLRDLDNPLWESAESAHLLGRVYLELYNRESDAPYLQKAQERLEKAARHDPMNPYIWLYLSEIKRVAGQFDQSVADLMMSLWVDIAEPRLMVHRVQVGFELWNYMDRSEKQRIHRQLYLARKYDPAAVGQLMKKFPEKGL